MDAKSVSSGSVDSDVDPDNTTAQSEEDWTDPIRCVCLRWVQEMNDNNGVAERLPPLNLLLHQDLLEKGWGWHRILPYKPGPDTWSDFKNYLENYFNKNKNRPASLCVPDSEPDGHSFSEEDPLKLAASLCIKVEEKLLNGCLSFLTADDIQLSHEIKDHAKTIIESSGESNTAAAGFMCITKEAELICLLSQCDFDATGLVKFSNEIRRSALNLLQSEKPECAAAMMGMTEEAILMHNLLSERTVPSLYEQYLVCQNIREATADLFLKLKDDLCLETAGDCTPKAKSEDPMGTNELKRQESDPKENYIADTDHCEKDYTLKGKKRKYKNQKKLH